MFKCQHYVCGKEFKATIRHERATGLYIVTCPHCRSVHESIEKGREPNGAATYRFQFRKN